MADEEQQQNGEQAPDEQPEGKPEEQQYWVEVMRKVIRDNRPSVRPDAMLQFDKWAAANQSNA